MSVLLETSLGDLVIDLDLEGSPVLCRNFLKLCKVRYYTSTLLHHVVPNRFVLAGDPTGTGHGGASLFGLLDKSEQHRFLASSSGRRLTDDECREKGRVVAVELYGLENTVGSQFLITTTSGPDRALDGYSFALKRQSNNNNTAVPAKGFLSLGQVVEDEHNLLDRWADCYADSDGRPYADWRIQRALVVYDPYEDPKALKGLLQERGVVVETIQENNKDNGEEKDNNAKTTDKDKPTTRVIRSPSPVRPPEETVQPRVPVEEVQTQNNNNDEDGVDPLQEAQFHQEIQRKEDRSRAVVLEMLGDLPDADITAPENVLFICKLNAATTDEDLQLILSRFDEQVHVDIVRDHDTGQSLNYAFAEFTTKEQATQAFLKMNQALVDDRRIVVDFSQSVAKLWDRHRQRYRGTTTTASGKRGSGGGPAPAFAAGGGGGGRSYQPRNVERERNSREPRSGGGERRDDRGRNGDDEQRHRYDNNRRDHERVERHRERDEQEHHRRLRDHDDGGSEDSRKKDRGRDRDRSRHRSGRDRSEDTDRKHRDRDKDRDRHHHHHDRERGRDSSRRERDRDHERKRDRDRDRSRDDDRDRKRYRDDRDYDRDRKRDRDRKDRDNEGHKERGDRRRDRDRDRDRKDRDRDEKHRKRSRKHH